MMRNVAERTIEATWRRLGTLLDAFPPAECANYFRNSGYGPADLPPKKWTGLGRHTLSESWADVAQGGMQATGIVEAVDKLEEVSAGPARVP